MQASGIVLSILLLLIAVFQILLAAGYPYGEAAWGGRQGKVLPRTYRIASGFSCLFFVFSVLVVLSKIGLLGLFHSSFVDGYMLFLTVYLGLGVVMNAVSRSKIERYWSPYIAVMFILCLLLI